jgi:hypothetical protein
MISTIVQADNSDNFSLSCFHCPSTPISLDMAVEEQAVPAISTYKVCRGSLSARDTFERRCLYTVSVS